MTTRGNIIIEDETVRVQLYRHADSYPEAMLPDLAAAMKYNGSLEYFEAQQFAAALIGAIVVKDQESRDKYDLNGDSWCGLLIDGFPKGWELLHSDIEWVYVVSTTDTWPTVKVYKWDFYWFNSNDPEKIPPIPFMEFPLTQSATVEIPKNTD